MTREFIPGDKVQRKHGSPTMEIIKYVSEHQFGVGDLVSDHHVECVWYENGEGKKENFDQRRLFKLKKTNNYERLWPQFRTVMKNVHVFFVIYDVINSDIIKYSK